MNNRLSEAKKIIRQRVQELNQEEKKLNQEMENHHKFVPQLEEWLRKIRTANQMELKEIAKELGLDFETSLLFHTFPKHFLWEELRQRLDEAKRRIDEIPLELESIKIRRKDANICPDCGGRGSFVKKNYIREDGIVAPKVTYTQCSSCQGRGRIEINNNLD